MSDKSFKFIAQRGETRVSVVEEREKDGVILSLNETGFMGGLAKAHLTHDELRLFITLLAKFVPRSNPKPAPAPSAVIPPADPGNPQE